MIQQGILLEAFQCVMIFAGNNFRYKPQVKIRSFPQKYGLTKKIAK